AGLAAGLIARYQTDGIFYLGMIQEDATRTKAAAYLFKFVAGAGFIQIGTPVIVATTGAGNLQLEILGSALKFFVNHKLVLSAKDTQIAKAGLAGIRGKRNDLIEN